MKAPKKISDLSKAISEGFAIIEQISSDIQRAETASQVADTIAAQLDELSHERAERRAMAFVCKTTADVADLNAREEELERASRQAIEDGQAATIAIRILTEKRADRLAEVKQLKEERRERTIAWLKEIRHDAINRYIQVLAEIGGPMADACAADRTLHALGAGEFLATSMLKQIRVADFAIPNSYKVQRDTTSIKMLDAPIPWLRDEALGDAETQALADELRNVGLNISRA
ncbi:hypothetical protein ATI14_0467 [Pseudomonas tolaasii NCPPB 2192]|uniref:Uncharacterized protein n=1 Tax=Pseudomonas tolaasii NCPPB 2192 TaxID=564423 RepID=A0ABX4QAA4_PSETO|nr:hypothetical protein [Pseudomonas tolaasii]ARB28959.1 hypothetical protein B5P22_17235 [Pseudomonas tolaasii]KAB0474772.1 hypothetical protein F7R12_14515 [Pseudomonas tolaasii]PKA73727.1 hypothetical protein ATI14_0467 [Pseudomonas tolaasii NCPPB 2192]